MIFNIMDFGAVGDGVVNDTVSVQAALDACSQNGGGRVVFPGGHVFRTGYIKIGSNTELHLEKDALLLASDNMDDFLPEGGHLEWKHSEVPSYVNCEFNGVPKLYFIHALDAENISFTGEGSIDGNESIFYGEITKWHIDGCFYPRVPLMFIENVRNLSIRDITLKNSAFWTVHLVGCRDVEIEHLTILNNLRMANCDGIDPDRCKNVRINNCHIVCADDCIVFKGTEASEKYGACENITVSNCSLTSTSAAVKFGTESECLFRNIDVRDCDISATNRGIALMLRDKGSIENVSFTNLNIETRLFSTEHYWGKAEPIYVTALKRKESTRLGHICNVSFENLKCIGENGIVIFGENTSEGNNISNISFKKVSVHICRKTDWPVGMLDLRPGIGDNLRMDGLRFMKVENADNVSFENMSFTSEGVELTEE